MSQCDGAFETTMNKGGIGPVFCDRVGDFIVMVTSLILCTSSVREHVELLAIEDGLSCHDFGRE